MDFQQRYGWSVLILVLAFAFTVEAADITGTWAIQDLQVADKVQLSLNVIQDGKGSFNNSSAFDISQLRGLTPAQMAAPAGTMARFELVREAGTFACEGYFKAGNGAGTFLFRPDPGFLQQMRAGLSGCQREQAFFDGCARRRSAFCGRDSNDRHHRLHGGPTRRDADSRRDCQLRWRREIFLMTQPPLLAVVQGGE